MTSPTGLFKFRQFPPDIILWAVRWYLRYTLSYRDLEEMMVERGVSLVHTTIYRWVQRYGPELDERCRRHLKPTNDSWKIDEAYLKVKGKDRYLWRAVDSAGNTLDSLVRSSIGEYSPIEHRFLLTAKRDAEAAKRFFRKVLQQEHVETPRVINTDKYAAYPKAIEELKESDELPKTTKHRQVKYLKNLLEQDHRFIKQRVKSKMMFRNFWSAQRTIRGYEAMNQIRKGQIVGVAKGDVTGQISFIHEIFGVAA